FGAASAREALSTAAHAHLAGNTKKRPTNPRNAEKPEKGQEARRTAKRGQKNGKAMGHHTSGQGQPKRSKEGERLQRRTFLASAAATLAARAPLAWAVPKPYSWEAAPPATTSEAFVKCVLANRGEEPYFLAQRFGRYQALLVNRDVLDERNKRAFLMTPREEFTLKRNQGRAYDHAFLDIGFGVTISGPHVVSRMTTSLDVKLGEKVLEIGTGSGYQSAYLANLTDKVW